MASPSQRIDLPPITVEEYLNRERVAEERSEYFDGFIVAMSGESPEHADISTNLIALVAGQLRGKPCRARTKDSKVRSGPPKPFSRYRAKGVFSYPDVVVVCDEVEYYDDKKDIILNPKVIIEVLSPSTETFDRGLKFQRYRIWNSTLADYVLISQDQAFVEHFRRSESGEWICRDSVGLAAQFTIDSIGCTIQLADLYERVEFRLQKIRTKKRKSKPLPDELPL